MKYALFNLDFKSVLMYLFLKSFLLFFIFSCQTQKVEAQQTHQTDSASSKDVVVPVEVKPIIVGAESAFFNLDSLKSKSIAIVANQTSRVDSLHLVDFLLKKNISIKSVFSPEHGFRGDADAGAKVASSVDAKTGLPLVSLYGKNKKPYAEQLNGIDLVIFDIQDVGARFYTYISTLHYVMEACAENDVKVLVLDRPNPNGHIIDGPVREKGLKSFVSMHPIPISHGMTMGEFALMINGEGWLKNNIKCNLEIVKCENYTHNMFYSLPVAPSPNLRSDASIALYPSLCLFEGTPVSVGRGTDDPFTVYGHPKLTGRSFSFTPKPGYGAASPRLNGKVCYGADLHEIGNQRLDKVRIDWLIGVYQDMGDENFFTTKGNWFDKLSGSASLREQIENNIPEQKIRASWEPALSEYKEMRKKYLLYD